MTCSEKADLLTELCSVDEQPGSLDGLQSIFRRVYRWIAIHLREESDANEHRASWEKYIEVADSTLQQMGSLDGDADDVNRARDVILEYRKAAQDRLDMIMDEINASDSPELELLFQ
ncbi:MAG: hypothetical protein R3F19_09940 [Verrucomicrobiales bacterium]